MAALMDSSAGLSEESRFARQYVLEEKAIGEGTYGAVYKGRCAQSGRLIAVKKMKPVHDEEGVPSTAIREVATLKNADHPNVVKLLDVYCALGKIYVVFEYIDQNLKEYMRKVGAAPVQGSTGPLTSTAACNFHAQLTKGTHFLHSHRIIHRDLKPQNVLVSNDLLPFLKICDFGMARAYSIPLPKYTHEVVTTWYRAPEILFGSEMYSLPIDMWSLGCILGEMATGSALFRGDCEIDTIFKIFQKLGTPSEAEWPGLNNLPDYKLTFPKWQRKPWSEIRNAAGILGQNGTALIDDLLRYDPRQRISAQTSLNHPYLMQDTDVAMMDFVLS
jgi:serine/threonine protein kinase